MKKTIFTIIGVAVAGALIAPNFIGQSAERDIKELVAAIDANPAYGAEIKSFQRSWFTSDAVLSFTMDFPVPQEDGSSEIVTLNSGEVTLQLQHGPVLTAFDSGMGLLAWQLTADDDSKRDTLTWPEQQPLYQLTGSMGLLGSASYQDNLADMRYYDALNEFTVNINGYRGSGAFDRDQFSYQGNNESVTFGVQDNVLVAVNEIAFSTLGKGTLIDVLNAGIIESDLTLSINQVVSQQQTVVSGLSMTGASELSADGGTIDIDVGVLLASAMLPTGEAKNLVLDMSMDRLDVEFMRAYQALANASYGQSSELMMKQLVALFEQHQQRVLSAQPQFAITELSGELPDGTFNASAQVSLDEINAFPAGNIPTDFWLQHMLAQGMIEADKPVVRNALKLQLTMALAQQLPDQDPNSEQMQALVEQQVNQVLNVYQQQGFIVEQEEQYRSAFELEDGTLTLNGKPIPLI